MGSIRIQKQLEPPWLTIEPIQVGDVPPGLRTPDRYIVVEDEREHRVRIDVYSIKGRDECFAFEDAVIWADWLVIGFGERVHLVALGGNHRTSTVDLESYFGHFYPQASCLLVASGERLFRLQPDGTLAWTSDVLGIDGVVVSQSRRNYN
jgi:hypothetical protein